MKYNCIKAFLGPDGEESILYPELEKLYGQGPALTKFREVAELFDSGDLEGYAEYPNGEPTIEVVKRLVEKGILGKPSATAVKAEKLDEITAYVARIKPLLQTRLAKYQAGEPGLSVKDKSVKELKGLLARIENIEALDAYVEVVKYADLQLRQASEFLTTTFKAEKAAAGLNEHSAALAEVAAQLDTFQDVVMPELARTDTTLREVLAGTNGQEGLQELRNRVAKLVETRTLETVRELVKQNANRQGLSDEELDAYLKSGADVAAITRAMGGASNSSLKEIAAAFTINAKAHLEAEKKFHADQHAILEAGQAFKKATGGNDFGYMLGKDKDGKATGRYVQPIGSAYYDQLRAYKKAVTDLGDYVEGDSLTPEEAAQNVARWHAKQALSKFQQAEVVDEQGAYTDGEHHRYTEEFKEFRSHYEEQRQDGKYWKWGRRQGNLGYATAEEAEEQYQRYLAKYYSPETLVNVMLKNKDGVPTGVVEKRPMRFTDRRATTEVVEERWRDPQYAAMLADTSKAGVGRLAFYNFFRQRLVEYSSLMTEEDVDHIVKGQLPAVLAKVAGQYNTGKRGALDWLGRLVHDPTNTVKEWLPAIKAGKDGIRTNEDGTVAQDVKKKYVGGFKDEKKIGRLEKQLAEVEAENTAKPFKEYETRKKRLQEALTIEHNRVTGGEVETNLPALLLCYGSMSRHYSEVKQQTGNFRLLVNSLENKEFYYENSDGTPRLDNGRVAIKEGSSQALRQLQDFIGQNVYQDLRLEDGDVAKLAALFQGFSSMTVQGFNVPAALKNLTVGLISNRIVASAGKFGLTKKSMTAALGVFSKDLYNIAADQLGDRLDTNNYVMRPSRSIVDAVMHYYNVLQEGNGVDEVKTGKLTDKLYLLTSAGEYMIQSTVAISKMSNTLLKGKDGREASFWQAHTLVNGTLRIDPNFEDAVAKLSSRLVLDIRNINKHISGNYAEDDKVGLQRTYYGRLALQYHKWAYNGFKAHFGRKQYDEGVGEETKGYYRSVGALWKALEGFSLKFSNYQNLSELDKQNLKIVRKELQYTAMMLALLGIIAYLKPDPDDDDKHFQYVAMNFAERVLNGSRQELTGYANPMDLYQNAKNPVAGLTFVKDIAVFTKDLMLYPAYSLTGHQDLLVYKTGTRKGDSRLLKSTLDLFPVTRMKRVVDQLQTTGTQWK